MKRGVHRHLLSKSKGSWASLWHGWPSSICSIRCCHGPMSFWWADWIGPMLSPGQEAIDSQRPLRCAACENRRSALTLPIE